MAGKSYRPYRPKHTLYFSKGLLSQYDNSGEEAVTELVNMEIELSKAKKRKGTSALYQSALLDKLLFQTAAEIILAKEAWLLLIDTKGVAYVVNGDGYKRLLTYTLETFTLQTFTGLKNAKVIQSARYIYIIYNGNQVWRIDSGGVVDVSDARVLVDAVDVSNNQADAPYFIKSDDGYPLVGDVRIAYVNNAGYLSKLSRPSYLAEMQRGFVSSVDGTIVDKSNKANLQTYGLATNAGDIQDNQLRAYYDTTDQTYKVSTTESFNVTRKTADDSVVEEGMVFALRPDGEIDVFSSSNSILMGGFKQFKTLNTTTKLDNNRLYFTQKSTMIAQSLKDAISFVLLGISTEQESFCFPLLNDLTLHATHPALYPNTDYPPETEWTTMNGVRLGWRSTNSIDYSKYNIVLSNTVFPINKKLYKNNVKTNSSCQLKAILEKVKSNKQIALVDLDNSSNNAQPSVTLYDSLIYVSEWYEDTCYLADALIRSRDGICFEHNFFDTWQIKKPTISYGFNPETLDFLVTYTGKGDDTTSFFPKSQTNLTNLTRFAVWNNDMVLAKSQKYFSNCDGTINTLPDSIVYTKGIYDDAITKMDAVPICSMEGSLLRRFPYPYTEVKLMNNVQQAVLSNNVLFVVDAGELWLSDEGMLLKSKVNIPDNISYIAEIADGILVFTNRNVYKVSSQGQSMLVLGGLPCYACKAINGGVVAVSTNNKIHLYTAKYTDNNFFQVEVQDLSSVINDVIFNPDSKIAYTNDTIYISNDRVVWGFCNGGWTKHYDFLYRIKDLFSFKNSLVIHFFQEQDMAEYYEQNGDEVSES